MGRNLEVERRMPSRFLMHSILVIAATGRSPHPRRKKTSSRSAVGSPSVNGNGGSGYNGAATP